MHNFYKILTIGVVTLLVTLSPSAQETSSVRASGGSADGQENGTVIGKEITLTAPDAVVVFAYWRQAKQQQASDSSNVTDTTTILLFHMAGSSARGEYAEIAPIFNAEGYNTLAVDLRSGGGRLGAPNQTADRLGDVAIGYCDAYPDMVAALDWVKTNGGGGPIVALGSSFSAGLVIKFGAEHQQDIAGVLAFSPASGTPMADCLPEPYLAQTSIPVVAFRPDREMAVESVITQAAAFRALGVPYHEIENGRHGSLMLRESQTGTDMDHAWRPVFRFLNGVSGSTATDVKLKVDGWQLQGNFVAPPSSSRVPAVLLLHGAARSRGIYSGLAQDLASRGIASLSIDMRAHGDSLNQGKFQQPWADHTYLLEGTAADIAAATAFLAQHSKVDPNRIAVVSASYSGEFMAVAARQSGYVQAYISLSPGSISDQSIEDVDPSGVPWLFVRAEQERPFFDDIFGAIEEKSNAEILVLPGKGHADRLLAQHPRLAAQLAAWLEDVLN